MRTASPLLDAETLRAWKQPDRGRTLRDVIREHLFILLLHATAILLFEYRQTLGVAPWMLVFVAITTAIVTGALLHRVALLGHEASHSMLAENRRNNDLLADLLCFFPIWSSLAHYRKKHTGHHHHPNEVGKDPNLADDRAERLFQSFPLESPRAIWRYYALFFWPPFVLGNLAAIFRLIVMGRGRKAKKKSLNPSALGVVYLVGLFVVLSILKQVDSEAWLVAGPIGYFVTGLLVLAILPSEAFAEVQKRLRYSARLGAALRLTFATSMLVGTTWCRQLFDLSAGFYYAIFWLIPLLYVVPYLMLLREIYQHANLGTGTLDNARVIRADAFTRWALLPYGNDYHLVHHLYPNVPYYRLEALHDLLVEQSSEYRNQVVSAATGPEKNREGSSVAESLAAKRPESHHPISSQILDVDQPDRAIV